MSVKNQYYYYWFMRNIKTSQPKAELSLKIQSFIKIDFVKNYRKKTKKNNFLFVH